MLIEETVRQVRYLPELYEDAWSEKNTHINFSANMSVCRRKVRRP